MSQAPSGYERKEGDEVRLPPPLSNYAVTRGGLLIGYWRRRVVLAGSLDRDGYRRFTLIRDDGSRTYPRLAILICTAFNGPCPVGAEVRHLNGLNGDDSAENLAWGTHQENIDDRERHGNTARGERIGTAKLNELKVREILESPRGSDVALALKFGVTASCISSVRRGKSWKHISRPLQQRIYDYLP